MIMSKSKSLFCLMNCQPRFIVLKAVSVDVIMVTKQIVYGEVLINYNNDESWFVMWRKIDMKSLLIRDSIVSRALI